MPPFFFLFRNIQKLRGTVKIGIQKLDKESSNENFMEIGPPSLKRAIPSD
jgi:hypothetical protein